MKTEDEIKKALVHQKKKRIEQYEEGNYNNQAFHEGWIFALSWILKD